MAHSIVWLEDALAQQPEVVGGKAAALSRLATEYPVPPGFCVVFATDDLQGVGLTKSFRHDLTAAYAELSKRCETDDVPVAVRSSAIGEDGEVASFAGQYKTLLNVRGEASLAEAVERCVASAFSPQVLAYYTQRGMHRKGAFTVLVQGMIAADVSAVAFSVNPVTGAQEVLINACWGLGETLVSGLVTPDSFAIHKRDGHVTSSHIAQKETMSVPAEQVTKQVPVPRELQEVSSLTDAQIVHIAELCIALEARFGYPVDLECSYQNGRLFLLQCRPVTAF